MMTSEVFNALENQMRINPSEMFAMERQDRIDEFARQAMQAVLGIETQERSLAAGSRNLWAKLTHHSPAGWRDDSHPQTIARLAYDVAEAMEAERERRLDGGDPVPAVEPAELVTMDESHAQVAGSG